MATRHRTPIERARRLMPTKLIQCGRFYPSWVRTAEDRLRHYSQFYPCVEVDSATYAIPRLDAVDRWLKATPAGFIFHVKAFGLFTNLNCPLAAVPVAVREQFKLEPARGTDQVRWNALDAAVQAMIWARFNDSVGLIERAGKLGVIVFQFQTSFHPSPENEAHLRQCRRALLPGCRMAIEFRDRSWLGSTHLARTMALLEELGAAAVIIDELKHELYLTDPPLAGALAMPIQIVLPHDAWAYVRVHRRLGQDKVLKPDEVTAWAGRLAELSKTVHGPIFFLWGTDHEDQPIRNMANLAQAVGGLVLDWKAASGGARRSLHAWFGAPAAAAADAHAAPLKEVAAPSRDARPPEAPGAVNVAPAKDGVGEDAHATAPKAAGAPSGDARPPEAPDAVSVAPAREPGPAPPQKPTAPGASKRPAPAAAVSSPSKKPVPANSIANFFVRKPPPPPPS